MANKQQSNRLAAIVLAKKKSHDMAMEGPYLTKAFNFLLHFPIQYVVPPLKCRSMSDVELLNKS